MKIKRGINTIFICVTLSLISLSVITYLRIENLIMTSGQIDHIHQVEIVLNNIFGNLKDVESGQRGYLLTNDSLFLDHYNNALENLRLNFKNMDSLAKELPIHKQNNQLLKSLVYNRVEQLKKTMEDAKTSKNFQTELLEGKENMNDVRRQINIMRMEEDRMLKGGNHLFKEETSLTPFLTISLMILFVLILIAAYYMLKQELNVSVGLKSDLEEKNSVLNATIKLLTKMNKELEAFTYISSHDLQEPLRKIQTFIKLLLEKEKDNLSDDGKFHLSRIYVSSKRMRKLMDDLLKYAHLKTSDRKFENAVINDIWEMAKTDYQEIIEEKKAIVEIDCPCSANVIRFQFRQLFDNLIDNSLKYAKHGIPPRISIVCKILPGTVLNNNLLASGKYYFTISIADNGIGFDPKYKDRIFELFQRLHNSDEYEGTGIGLAICKRIVENHNGVITATGKLNAGAKFDIYIPV